MDARQQQREFLEKHLRIRRFMNRWVSTPCLIISIIMLFSFPQMALFWLLMTVLNGFAVLTNWAVGNAIERNLDSLGQLSEVDRQRKIDELYGRNQE